MRLHQTNVVVRELKHVFLHNSGQSRNVFRFEIGVAAKAHSPFARTANQRTSSMLRETGCIASASWELGKSLVAHRIYERIYQSVVSTSLLEAFVN